MVVYLQQIAELQKENFSLKLRIYFLEERMKKDGNTDEDVYNVVRIIVLLDVCWMLYCDRGIVTDC